MKLKVDSRQKPISIEVRYKDIKSVRLKVFPSQEVKISVPLGTPEEWINRFVKSKQSWIAEKLLLFEQTKAIEKETNIKSGVSTRILGRQIKILVHYAKKKKIVTENREAHLYSDSPENQEAINRQFANWWRKSAKMYFTEVLEKLYPIIEKHKIAKPRIVVKKMQTLWGSCSRTRGTINLNYYLYKAPVPCIEYVILHEITHLLYQQHNKDFYDFLTIYMPDWRERKRKLDYEIVWGL